MGIYQLYLWTFVLSGCIQRGVGMKIIQKKTFMTELKIVKVVVHAEKKRGIFGLKNTTISIDSKKSFVSHF